MSSTDSKINFITRFHPKVWTKGSTHPEFPTEKWKSPQYLFRCCGVAAGKRTGKQASSLSEMGTSRMEVGKTTFQVVKKGDEQECLSSPARGHPFRPHTLLIRVSRPGREARLLSQEDPGEKCKE